MEDENVSHIFITCPYTRDVWGNILKDGNLSGNWEDTSLISCMKIGGKRAELIWRSWLEFASRFGYQGIGLYLEVNIHNLYGLAARFMLVRDL